MEGHVAAGSQIDLLHSSDRARRQEWRASERGLNGRALKRTFCATPPITCPARTSDTCDELERLKRLGTEVRLRLMGKGIRAMTSATAVAPGLQPVDESPIESIDHLTLCPAELQPLTGFPTALPPASSSLWRRLISFFFWHCQHQHRPPKGPHWGTHHEISTSPHHAAPPPTQRATWDYQPGGHTSIHGLQMSLERPRFASSCSCIQEPALNMGACQK